MNIVIVGAGAIGSWIGGKLSVAGQDVTLLTTNVDHREAINKQGLTLIENQEKTIVKVSALSPAELNTPADLMLLVTKSFQSRQALQDAKQGINDNTLLMSVQNGLGNIEAMAECVDETRILASTTMMPIDKIEPGVVEAKGNGATYFGYPFDQTISTDNIIAIFQNSGLDVQAADNILQRIWTKVAFNVGMNAVCALTHGTPGTIGESPEATTLVKQAAEEAVAVATAEGVALDIQSVFQLIEFACREHGDHKASMLQDLLARKRTEVESLNGAIVERAKKANIDVPVNQTLKSLVRLAEVSYQRYG